MNVLAAAVSLLPVSMQDRAKGIIGLILSVATVASATIPSTPDWVTIALAVATAPAVYFTPNLGYKDKTLARGGE